jgi:hypothetical protein
MFRHGAVQDAAIERGPEYAKLRSGHESDKCLNLYARSDAERESLKCNEATTNINKEKLAAKYLTNLENERKKMEQQQTIAGRIFVGTGQNLVDVANDGNDRANELFLHLAEAHNLYKMGKFTDAEMPVEDDSATTRNDEIARIVYNVVNNMKASLQEQMREGHKMIFDAVRPNLHQQQQHKKAKCCSPSINNNIQTKMKTTISRREQEILACQQYRVNFRQQQLNSLYDDVFRR